MANQMHWRDLTLAQHRLQVTLDEVQRVAAEGMDREHESAEGRAWDRFSLALNLGETGAVLISAALGALDAVQAEHHDPELAQWFEKARHLMELQLDLQRSLRVIARRIEGDTRKPT